MKPWASSQRLEDKGDLKQVMYVFIGSVSYMKNGKLIIPPSWSQHSGKKMFKWFFLLKTIKISWRHILTCRINYWLNNEFISDHQWSAWLLIPNSIIVIIRCQETWHLPSVIIASFILSKVPGTWQPVSKHLFSPVVSQTFLKIFKLFMLNHKTLLFSSKNYPNISTNLWLNLTY